MRCTVLLFVSLTTFAADPKPKGFMVSPSNPEWQTLCGWLDNPTPGNWELTDKNGRWTIGVQGGFQADGELPDFEQGPRYWKETNGSYGFGCACLKAKTEVKDGEKTIVRYTDVKVLPLTKCKTDKALPQTDR